MKGIWAAVAVAGIVLMAVAWTAGADDEREMEREPGWVVRAPREVPRDRPPMREVRREADEPVGPPHAAPPMQRPPEVELILANAGRIGLNEEQVADLKRGRLETRLAAIELRARMEQAEVRLEAALDGGEVELEQVRELLHEIAEAQAEIRFAEIRLGVEARRMLNEEQRQRLAGVARGVPWRGRPEREPEGPPPRRGEDRPPVR